jgi:hypothetical protein
LSPEEVSACEARLESVVQWVESSTSFSAREIRERWCRMVAQPLWNAEAIAHSDEKGEAALRKGRKVSWELKG